MHGWILLINILNWGISTEILHFIAGCVLPVPSLGWCNLTFDIPEKQQKLKWRVGCESDFTSCADGFSKCKITEKEETSTCKFTVVFISYGRIASGVRLFVNTCILAKFEQVRFTKTELQVFKWCSLVFDSKATKGKWPQGLDYACKF